MKNKIMNKKVLIVTAVILVLVIVIVFIALANGKNTEASMFWKCDEYEKFMKDSIGDESPELNHEILMRTETEGLSCEGIYTLTIKGEETLEIVAQGEFEYYEFENGIKAYFGAIDGVTEIDGVEYELVASVNYDIDEERLFASISLYTPTQLFFSAGTPFLSAEMIEEIEGAQ